MSSHKASTYLSKVLRFRLTVMMESLMLKVCGIKTFNHGSYKLWQPEKRSGHKDEVPKRLPLKLCFPRF